MQGKTISGYTLQRLLGTGGMAEVWYAESKIGSKAAVKIMSEKLSYDDSMRERFLNEAKVMVVLDHPNIRKVYGFDEIDGRPAIVMEYLEGSDLKAMMKGGQRFTQEELEKWWNQLADALNYTHAQDIIHRDIKPSNIFIDQWGNAKLLDFGIAKMADTTNGTQTGSTLGTRIYMSPEQVRDPKRVGPPSDVYSLAVSFVHLLTGKAPYDSTTSSDYDIQESIVRKPVDMSKVPDTWRGFLLPYLEKDSAKRPALRPFEAVPQTGKPETSQTLDDDEGTIVSGSGPKTALPDTSTIAPQTPHGGRSASMSNHRSLAPESADKPKRKTFLWIALGLVAVVVVLVALLLKPKNNGHEYVDLGLPSGTLWATCNVGASKPEDYGDYFAWGETSTKSTYNWDTYKYAEGTSWDDPKLTKYCDRSDYGNNGFTDIMTILQDSDDAATANWGTDWRMPTDEEWQELLDNTTSIWTTQNGVNGWLFTARNGQTLFLPATGVRWDGEDAPVDVPGGYWSRSVRTGRPQCAKALHFHKADDLYMNSKYDRGIGLPVRPVRKR